MRLGTAATAGWSAGGYAPVHQHGGRAASRWIDGCAAMRWKVGLAQQPQMHKAADAALAAWVSGDVQIDRKTMLENGG